MRVAALVCAWAVVGTTASPVLASPGTGPEDETLPVEPAADTTVAPSTAPPSTTVAPSTTTSDTTPDTTPAVTPPSTVTTVPVTGTAPTTTSPGTPSSTVVDATSAPTTTGSGGATTTVASTVSAPTTTTPVSLGRAVLSALEVLPLTTDPTGTVTLDKTNTADGEPAGDNTSAQPGDNYTYNFSISCSSIEVDCVDMTFTETFPPGVVVDESTIPPSIPGYREVTWNDPTLTVVYEEPLANPPGETGMAAGTTGDNFQISVTLPADTDLEDGDVILNTATASTFDENGDPIDVEDPSDVTVDIPVVLDAETTKTFSDPSAIAGDPNATTTVELTGANQSSNSAEVTEMTIEDSDPDMYEYLDVTSVTVNAPYPTGASQAQLYVCPEASAPCDDSEWVAGGTGTAPGPSTLAMPGSVPADQVVGVRVVFTAPDGSFIENEAGGGTADVDIDMALRDTVRSTGQTITEIPSTTIVNNTASTMVDDDDPATDPGTDTDDAEYQILPPTIVIEPGKTFFPDANGNYTTNNGEHAVIDENSGVSMILDATNGSAFPISSITITEPATSNSASEFEKFDPDSMTLTFPDGAVNAHVTVTYESDPTTDTDYAAPGPGTIALHPPDSKVTSITVTFTGDPNVDGGNTIQPGSPASVGIHGNLNDLVDDSDVNGPGIAAGIDNCVDVTGAGTPYPGGTGSAVGTACAELPVEDRDPGTGGQKIPSQTNLPDDQPLVFTMRTRNNGNIPLFDLVVTDPPDDGTGIPPTPDENSIFYWGEFVGATVAPASMVSRVTVEVYLDGAWEELDTVDAADYPDVIAIRGLIDVLGPTESFDLNLGMIARVPQPPGTIPPDGLINCYGITADTSQGSGEYVSQTHCSPPIVPAPTSESASINKAIAPETLPRPIPGMDPQSARVTLQIYNTGTISARVLQLTDNDADFWDAVDFGGIVSVQAPAVGELRDADQLRIDAWVDPDGAGPDPGSWTVGAVTSPGSPSVPVPDDQVRGLRFTFTDSLTANGGNVMTTCAADPDCGGIVNFDVIPRETLVSTGGPIPDGDTCPPPDDTETDCSYLLNTASGAMNTQINPDDDDPYEIPEVSDDLILVPGTPALDVDKGPADSTVQPGQLATFTLVTTNTGTANLPDLTVSDPMPDGILFNDAFNQPNDPYTIAWSNLPDGYPAPPDPVFETTADPTDPTRVGLLRWTFPGWDMPPNAAVTIVFGYTLQPGVNADDVIVNTMGASSPVDGLECSDTNDGQVTDGDFGDGLYCTDGANVTVTAGASFTARKWVAGNPALGWFNQATGLAVPLGDPSCLSLDANGRTYTTNPCIALVNPGEPFFYVLRAENAGTESALSMVIVDTFPAPGDTGVFGADRGTQWASAPTLAGDATYSGPTTGTIEYTTGAACAGGFTSWPCDDADWTAPANANATALRLVADFDPDTLPPGGIVDVSFSMTTPADVPFVADPTVAYNSFAHSETTQIATGGVRFLTPVEPLKVGVATSYGSLQVNKAIGDNPANLDLDDVEFTFTYECTLTNGTAWSGNGTVTATPTTPGVVTGIPAGSSCDVWESGTNGGIADTTQASPATVVIPPFDPATPVVASVTVTNDFPLGELSILKTVTGFVDPTYTGGPYPAEVTCSFNGTTLPGFPQTISLVPGTPNTDIEAPVGSVCTVVETDDLGATTVTYTPANADGSAAEVTVPPTDGAVVSVGITNNFPPGYISLLKEVAGDVDPVFTAGPFEVEMTCTFNGVALPGYAPRVIELTPDVVSGPYLVPVGSVCTVVETDDQGATSVTYDPADTAGTAGEVVVPASSTSNAPVTITITNDFPDGGLQVNKQIGENDADLDLDDIEYVFAYTCTFDTGNGEITSPDPFGLLTATVNDPAEVDGLPAGAVCEVWETVPGNQGGIPSATEQNPAVVTIVAGTTVEPYTPVTITNDYPTGRVELVKVVEGDVRDDFTGGPYEILVNCWAPDQTPGTGTPFPGFPVTVDVVPGVPVGAELPVGTVCWFQEQDVPDGVTVTYDPTLPPVVDAGVVIVPSVAPDGVLETITVTNDFEDGSLVIEKTVSGPGAPAFSQGPFVFGVRCAYLDDDDAFRTVVVVNGSDDGSPVQSDPVTGLPIGAECTVTEIDNGGADEVAPPQTVVIEQDQQANVAIVGLDNPFSAGSVSIVKQVDGSAASSSYVTGLSFDIDVECAVDVNGVRTTVLDDTVTVAPDGVAVTVVDADGDPVLVPLGSRCWASEPDGLGARAVTIEHDSYDTGVEVVADAEGGTQPLEIDVTNTFDAAALTVTKLVVNERVPGAAYTFTVTCTITHPDGSTTPVPLLSGSSPVSIPAGQSVTFDVLSGSTCLVTETGADGASVTYVESGGEADGNTGDGSITLVADGSVTVTNTYPAVLPRTGSAMTADLLRAALMVVAVGALAMLATGIGRRRRAAPDRR